MFQYIIQYVCCLQLYCAEVVYGPYSLYCTHLIKFHLVFFPQVIDQ